MAEISQQDLAETRIQYIHDAESPGAVSNQLEAQVLQYLAKNSRLLLEEVQPAATSAKSESQAAHLLAKNLNEWAIKLKAIDTLLKSISLVAQGDDLMLVGTKVNMADGSQSAQTIGTIPKASSTQAGLMPPELFNYLTQLGQSDNNESSILVADVAENGLIGVFKEHYDKLKSDIVQPRVNLTARGSIVGSLTVVKVYPSEGLGTAFPTLSFMLITQASVNEKGEFAVNNDDNFIKIYTGYYINNVSGELKVRDMFGSMFEVMTDGYELGPGPGTKE